MGVPCISIPNQSICLANPSRVDPEVSTLSTLTNVQNSLFVPDLGRFVNRNPTYTLSRERESDDEESLPESPAHEGGNQSEEDKLRKHDSTYSQKRLLGDFSYSLEDPQFAVLPEGSHLEGWSKEDLIELNDHVRHMLHSKRSKFKRSMKGFVKYISKRKFCPEVRSILHVKSRGR